MTSDSDYSLTTIEYYNKEADSYFKGTVSIDMEDLYQPFMRLLPKGARILDAGCGSGRDSLYFKHQGFDVVAFDAAEELVKLSTEHIGQKVLHLTFNDLPFENEFDGIWACASLLHVLKAEMHSVMNKLQKALKPKGVLYASFKYGTDEKLQGNRFFNSYDEITFKKLLNGLKGLTILEVWKTEDIREDRKGEFWLNALVRKAGS